MADISGKNIESSNEPFYGDEEVLAPVKLPKRPPIDDEMDITPMIDMTFLLLIFFILTSKMTAEQTYALPMAKHGDALPTKSCIILNVRSAGDSAAVISRADETVFSDDPEQQAAEVGEYIQQGFNMRKTEVLIRADGTVRNGEIKRIKEIVSDSLDENQMINIGVIDEQS
jgi:biopolymer transport protein ExbD